MKKVEIDGQTFKFGAPEDCCFNYDYLGCRNPLRDVERCPDETYIGFPADCPLKDDK
jgi:hypothetical protein